MDSERVEHHRFVGFLPPKEFLASLELGLARADFNRGKFDEAGKKLEALVDSEEAPIDVVAEACYWLGVARFKAIGNREAAAPSWKKLVAKYPDTSWAKRVAYMFE
jgi:tetratricopeptide (TPR) repeat protein